VEALRKPTRQLAMCLCDGRLKQAAFLGLECHSACQRNSLNLPWSLRIMSASLTGVVEPGPVVAKRSFDIEWSGAAAPWSVNGMLMTEEDTRIQRVEVWCTKHDCALVERPWAKPLGMLGSHALVCLECVVESRERLKAVRLGAGRT
jgi:hypothetical protein